MARRGSRHRRLLCWLEAAREPGLPKDWIEFFIRNEKIFSADSEINFHGIFTVFTLFFAILNEFWHFRKHLFEAILYEKSWKWK